ncbi:MAG TPA: acetyl-CoA C-acetyltransferase, partial [Patescibacteria group bacterium]|nr:acetyl-CoA C-acetyltransferase [Patescibacteria group bacterium]
MKEVFIITAKRTPIGSFLGTLANHTAPELGAIALKEAYTSAALNAKFINSVYMGNVLSANLGQAPARQAAKLAGIPNETDCTTINKVCSSGLKAICIGAQQIQLSLEDIVAAGGMESMSNTPHYTTIRKAGKLRNEILVDGLLRDGLTDAYNNSHMGHAAEMCAAKYEISREQQDEFALRSYEKAVTALKSGKFNNEIVSVTIKSKTGESEFYEDEDVAKLIPEKVSKLKPAFVEDGTITAANASN